MRNGRNHLDNPYSRTNEKPDHHAPVGGDNTYLRSVNGAARLTGIETGAMDLSNYFSATSCRFLKGEGWQFAAEARLNRLQSDSVLMVAVAAAIAGLLLAGYQILAFINDWTFSAAGMIVGVGLVVIGLAGAAISHRSD